MPAAPPHRYALRRAALAGLAAALALLTFLMAHSAWWPASVTTVALAQSDEAGAAGVHEGAAGPYHVRVEVVPPVPAVGKVQFRVRPQLETGRVPVADARVEVYLGRGAREEIKTPALNSPADRTTYIGNAEVDQSGDWAVRVEVVAGAGNGELVFSLPVRSRARSGGGLVAPTLVYLGAALVVVAGVAWLIRSSRRARRNVPR